MHACHEQCEHDRFEAHRKLVGIDVAPGDAVALRGAEIGGQPFAEFCQRWQFEELREDLGALGAEYPLRQKMPVERLLDRRRHDEPAFGQRAGIVLGGRRLVDEGSGVLVDGRTEQGVLAGEIGVRRGGVSPASRVISDTEVRR